MRTFKSSALGLPRWRSGWESACQCRGRGFEPWSGRIPHAAEQLSPWATTTEPARLEPVLRNKRGRDSERPAHRDEEWPPLATTRESPHTATKTQHSQKKKKQHSLMNYELGCISVILPESEGRDGEGTLRASALLRRWGHWHTVGICSWFTSSFWGQVIVIHCIFTFIFPSILFLHPIFMNIHHTFFISLNFRCSIHRISCTRNLLGKILPRINKIFIFKGLFLGLMSLTFFFFFKHLYWSIIALQ